MSMKLAIITDIHGNAPALQAALADIEREGVDHLYCLGDLIAIGPNTNEVLDMLFSRGDIAFVKGNHDEAVLSIIQGKGPLPGHEHARSHHEWVASQLDKSFIPKLLELPQMLEVDVFGKNFLFVHYHLKSNGQIKRIDPDPSGEKLDTMYDGTPYDVVCFGHHHPVHHFQTNKRLYLNPGALGCHHQPYARYGIVEVHQNRQVTVQLKEIPYDNTDFIASFERLQVPQREFILKVFYGVE
jgi:putative phosphoesterase